MTERVPADEIENIVGRKRSVKDHYARAVSAERTVYILHSRECLAMHADLRECPWSLALDRGIDLSEWVEDVPLTVRVRDGRLVPSPAQVRFFRRRESGGFSRDGGKTYHLTGDRDTIHRTELARDIS